MEWSEATDGALAGERCFGAFDDAVADVLGALNAAVGRLVGLVRQCLDDGTWQAVGCRSPEHWVAARCGLGTGRAAKLVRIARRIHEFPLLEAQARAGLVTEDHLAVVAAHAHGSHDLVLADCAPVVNVAQLRRIIRGLPVPGDDPVDVDLTDDDEVESGPAGRDVFVAGWGDDGRFRGRFDLGAELGALVDKTLRAARSRLYVERTGRDADGEPAGVERIGMLDVLERTGQAALAGLDPAVARQQRPGDRYQILIHLDADDPASSRVHLGPLLDHGTRRMLTCDADVRAVTHSRGRPGSLGRRKRVVDPLLRALIEERDGGCVVCGAQGFLHIHHLWHWEDGGPTDDDNLAAFCTSCHRAVHQGRLTVLGDPTHPDGLVILGPRGQPLPKPRATEVRGFAPADRPYPGPDRSGRWRPSPFDLRDTDDDAAMTIYG